MPQDSYLTVIQLKMLLVFCDHLQNRTNHKQILSLIHGGQHEDRLYALAYIDS